MQTTLQFGSDSQISFDLPEEAIVAEWRAAGDPPVSDPGVAAVAALAEPLGYPPLASATVPGDRVAILVERGLPQAESITAGVLDALARGGVEDENITIVQADLPSDPHTGEISRQVHDTGDRDRLSYLALGKDDQPVFLNRAICDADLVVPLLCVRRPTRLDSRGVFAGLYPDFSDQATIERFADPRILRKESVRKRQRGQIDHAAWLLGVRLVLLVVPGPDGSVQKVIAGDFDTAAPAADACSEATWSTQSDSEAGLVVAAIGGGPEQQTWQNIARAIEAASHAVAAGGAIAICSELDHSPGESLSKLGDARDISAAITAIENDRTSDAVAAMRIAQAIEQGLVYLLSQLAEEVVESLGFAPVAHPEEIARLAARHRACVLIEDAQYVAPCISGE